MEILITDNFCFFFFKQGVVMKHNLAMLEGKTPTFSKTAVFFAILLGLFFILEINVIQGKSINKPHTIDMVCPLFLRFFS